MANKPTHAPRGAEWEGDWDASPEPEATPGGRHMDAVAQVLAALPAGEDGRTLKLALLDALDAGAQADRVALPIEMRGLRARVRAGTA